MPEITFHCPQCAGQLTVDSIGVGKAVPCPLCKAPIVIPSDVAVASQPVLIQGSTVEQGESRVNAPLFAQIFYEGDKILGRYRVVTALGEGGMGVVYRCVDEIGGIEVALKAFPPDLSHDEATMQEVRDNFKLIEKLHHPNIAAVKTLECDVQTGDYYLIMEYVEGRNLYHHRKQLGGRLTLEQALPILRQIAVALDFAHGEKIVHRDIKPANLMVRRDGTVKLLDFGLAAKIHAEHVTDSAEKYDSSGTGIYMAPEQWRGDYQGAATDQYALACTAYELLAGRVPFTNPDLAVLQETVLTAEPPPIVGLDAQAAGALLRGLAKDWKQRFISCGKFVQTLSGQNIETIPAQNENSFKPVKSPARFRKRKIIWILAISLVSLLGLVAGAILYRQHEHHQADKNRASIEKQQYLDNLAGEIRALLDAGNISVAREKIAKAETLGLSNTTVQQLKSSLAKTVLSQDALQRFAQASVAREKALKVRRNNAVGILLDQMEVAWRAAEAARSSGRFGEALNSYNLVVDQSREILKADIPRNQSLTASNSVVDVTNDIDQTDSLSKSTLKDGIPDLWKKKYGFDVLDTTVAKADPDNDGFNNLEEYRADTNPRDVKSHPDVTSKLRVWSVKQRAFRLRYMSSMYKGTNVTFQIYLRSGRTVFVKLGDVTEGYTIFAHEPKATEGDVVVLQKGAEQLRLVKGRDLQLFEMTADLILMLDHKRYNNISKDMTVKIRDHLYNIVEVTANAVTIRGPQQGDVAVVPLSSESERVEVYRESPAAQETASAVVPVRVPSSTQSDARIERPPVAAPIAEIFRFDSLLARPDLWRLTSSDFGAAVQGSGFYWLDNQKNAARAGGAIKLQFMNHRIWEALVKFESNHISRVDLSFYNRGDANDSYVGHDSFTNLIRQICISLCSWTGVSGQILSSLPGPRRTIIHHGAWNKPPTRLELEWSAVWLNMKEEPFRAEFIRLKVFPITALTVAAKERPNLGRTPIDLKAHVQTATNGDIFLSGVPMVDQGEKGYCGAAVASRLMQYYGLDFDIHQAAMVADTSPTDGTTEDNIIESYKRIAQKTNLRFFTLRKFSLLINCDADNINPSVLNQFAADVARQINVGVPLVWGVRLGMVHEENLKIKTLSSHLRLIIGYNKKTGDILYSDSWGPGHECKRMPLKYAVRITNGLLVLKPDNL